MSTPLADPPSTNGTQRTTRNTQGHPDYRAAYESVDPDQRPAFLLHPVRAFNDADCKQALRDDHETMVAVGYRFVRCMYISADGRDVREVARAKHPENTRFYTEQNRVAEQAVMMK